MIPQPVPAGDAMRESNLAPRQPAGPRLRHAWKLLSSYWVSKDWKFAWFALIVLLGFQFGGAYLMVRMNRWEQSFFDSVEQRNADAFAALVLTFLGLMVVQVCVLLFQNFVGKLLSIRWRTFMTHHYIDRWMSRNRFSEIERLRLIDNPDQRIAVDIEQITEPLASVLNYAIGFVGSMVTAISFAMILMETAAPIAFTAFGTDVSIPGSTVWYAIIYVLLGSWIITKVGKPYIRATMRQQHVEGDFRANLIHVRRNAAQIGLVGAGPMERAGLFQSFDAVRRNFWSVILSSLGLNFSTNIYQRIGSIIPLFILVPRFFSGAITFGQVMGARDAFERLTMHLSYFVQAYPAIAAKIAHINRLKGLDDAIDQERPRGIVATGGAAAGLALATENLELRRPHGETLVTIGDWQVRMGERWLIEGPSGAGKSTLLRAIAGVWPDGAGTVRVTNDTLAMFVPQRLYLPLGSLKAAICFPDKPEAHSDAEIVALLDRVRLGSHADDLHALRIWQEELSPGEQQRIALARILLHKPSFLILDEATSALDPDNARHFYECIQGDMPGLTLLSVVHDEKLRKYHCHAMTIADGQATIGEVAEDQA